MKLYCIACTRGTACVIFIFNIEVMELNVFDCNELPGEKILVLVDFREFQ